MMTLVAVPAPTAPAPRPSALPALLAGVLLALSLVAVVVRLDAPSDPTVLVPGRDTWSADGVLVDVLDGTRTSPLRAGDLVTTIGEVRLSRGLGGLTPPRAGDVLPYGIVRNGVPRTVRVTMARPDVAALVRAGWGDLVFVVAFGALGVALYLRRRDEPATGPLLVVAVGLFGSTLVVVAGLPALALAVGGPRLVLFHLCSLGVYSVAWGGLAAFSLALTGAGDRRWRGRRVTTLAYAAPPLAAALWALGTRIGTGGGLAWLGQLHVGETTVALVTLVSFAVWGVLAYIRTPAGLVRTRLRWLAGGGAATVLVSIAGWELPELVTGRQLFPAGSLGLSGLPFVVAMGVALRRHRLFDIEKLANRALVYVVVVLALLSGYVALVSLLVAVLQVSGTVAAAVTAAAAALALAPLRAVAQGTVNRLMYGDRDDPAAVLDRLGAQLEAVLPASEVLPVIVRTVAQSLRVPFVAVELADGAGGFRRAAQYGDEVEPLHAQRLLHRGTLVGRLLVAGRGSADPLEPADLTVLGVLAQQVGAAVEAVRLQDDLRRSRAEVVALREEERRRLRRDLHDGMGPALAAIGLKAHLATRDLPAGSPARRSLAEIAAEARDCADDVRRLVEALRPPALDELGLVGALRSRAATFAGGVTIEVAGQEPNGVPLPAAVETAAFRIAVEAMTNAVRHSHGRRCLVEVAQEDGALWLSVSDDGVGVRIRDPAIGDGRPGVGLRSMRERAAEVGGACSVLPAPGGGTLVEARLPLALGDRP
jgi:signal transduction histidine kinase